jgi:hypothetical protein
MRILLLVNWQCPIGSFEVSLNYCFENRVLFDAEDDSSVLKMNQELYAKLKMKSHTLGYDSKLDNCLASIIRESRK